MSRTLRAGIGLLGCLAIASLGCNYDTANAPPSITSTRAQPRAFGLGIQLLTPAERTTPLAADITWSFSAGPQGAVSTNSGAGLTVIIPAGALATTQMISVTALAGNHVAYRFEPHLAFDTKVRLEQNLATIRAPWLALVGGHFSGDLPEFVNQVVRITESVPAIISLLHGTVSLHVDHFSGWILGSGNESSSPDGGSTQ
jgi:hypothetical protein